MKLTEVHNSMRHNNNNRFGLKKGQIINGRTISHITMTGEVFFKGGGWDYDYEMCKHIELEGNSCKLKFKVCTPGFRKYTDCTPGWGNCPFAKGGGR